MQFILVTYDIEDMKTIRKYFWDARVGINHIAQCV
jgi:hypothetical protein